MDIMDAFDQTVKSTREYLDKNMATNLTVIDDMLYLSNDTGVISDGVQLPSGGGGGGGGGFVKLKNLLDSTILTIAEGSSANLIFEYTSTEDTGPGTATVYVGGNLKDTLTITQGSNTIDVSPYVGDGANEVKITCSDAYSNQKSLLYTVNVVSLKITSTFDDSQQYSGDINIRYVVYGLSDKTIHFVVDGVDNTIIVTETGRQKTYTIPAMEHGSHILKIYATATINGTNITSNELLYDIMCIKEGVTAPMISSPFNLTKITQGEVLSVPFSVYDPVNMETEVTLEIKQGDKVYSTSTRIVDRTRQLWTTRSYPVGEITLVITYGNTSKTHNLIVIENKIDVSIKTTDLEFQLKAAGKSNADNDRDIWENNGITTTFENMNWGSVGWIDDENGDTALRLSGDARAIINFKPFSTDARQTGRAIELVFAIRDVNNRDAVAISCFDGSIGFAVAADTAVLMSEQSKISCNYTEEEKIHVAFSIEARTDYRLMCVYLNGVLSGVKQYPENDNWQMQTPVDITVGSPYCNVDLYEVRSYSTSLISEEARDNYIADITDIGEKSAVFADNDIYDDFGHLSFSKLQNKLPILVITGDLPKSKGDKKDVVTSFTHPDYPSLNFEDTAKIDVQGTSSQWYIRKNYKNKYKAEHMLALDQLPTNVFTWKADFAESTSSHNTGSANYVHTLYGDIKTPPQEKNDKIRTTVYGYPALIFHKADNTSEPEFLGKYNANTDKSSNNVYGLTDEYPLAESWEFLNNTSDACLFHGNVPDEWADDFEARYPDKSEDMTHFKVMHDWVVSTWQDGATNTTLSETYTGVDGDAYTQDTAEYRLAKFKKEFTEHFDFNFCLLYYVYTFVFLMVDQRAKNMFLTTWDGVHYQPWFYDNDTIMGINNEGQLVFSPWLEDDDKLGTADVFNGATSALWVNFRTAFAKEIKEFYQELRSSGKLSYDKIIEYFVTRQTDKWSISIYNEDSDFKYVAPLRDSGDATNLYQVRGTGKEHLKFFAKNRLAYCDSKWYGADYADDYVSLRIYTPDGDLAIPANANITVTPFSDMYAGVMYRANGTLKQKRAKANIPITFEAPSETFNDTETGIYGASNISSLGDLAPLYCGSLNASKAVKLTELIVGSQVEGYSNPNLHELAVGANKLLKKVEVSNCPNFTNPLALSQCPNIEEIYAVGSGITGVELPSSGYLKKIYLPNTITNLTVTNQIYIEEFHLDGYDALTTLRIEKTVNIPVEDIMLNAPNLNRVRLLDVTWHAESEEALRQTIEKLKSCLGLDASGNNTDKAVVTGKVTIDNQISDELAADIYDNFPNLVVDDGSGKPYIINYKDRDGASLYLLRLADGEDAIDPIAEGYIETPASIEGENYKYVFSGWSAIPKNVHQNYIVTAQYNTLFAIKYYNGDALIHTQYAIKGEPAPDPVADGIIAAPTKEGTDDLHYLFASWDNLPNNVQATTSVYAHYSNVYPVRFYTDSDLAHLFHVQWVVEGNDSYDPVEKGDTEDPIKEGTDDVRYSFRCWNTLPKNVVAIQQVYALYDNNWAVRFHNDDAIVNTQWIFEGKDAVDPVEAGMIDTPTRVSTAQYHFTFLKWDGDYTNVTEARDIIATYRSILRSYPVYFYNGDALLHTVENVQYGSSATYTGETPTKLGVDNPEEYEFKRWVPEPTNITGPTICRAIFRFNGYLKDDWATIAAHCSDGTATSLYQIGARKELSFTINDKDYIADMEIIAHNHDNLADGSGKAPLTFMCKDLPDYMIKFNETNDNVGGWETCLARSECNGTLFSAFPEELQVAIKPVIKLSDGGIDNMVLIETVDSVWVPSYDEMALSPNKYALSGQGEPYSSTFSDNESRRKYLDDGTTAGYITRSSYLQEKSRGMIYRITAQGSTYTEIAFNSFNAVFGFCL